MYCFICKKYVTKQDSVELLRKHVCLDCYNKYGNTTINNQLRCSNCGYINKELSPCNFSVVKNKPIQEVQEYCDQISECSNRSKPIKPEIFYWLYKKYNKDLKTLSKMFKVTIHTLEKWMEIYRSDNR